MIHIKKGDHGVQMDMKQDGDEITVGVGCGVVIPRSRQSQLQAGPATGDRSWWRCDGVTGTWGRGRRAWRRWRNGGCFGGGREEPAAGGETAAPAA
jgi:hypothetical protein